MLRVAPKYRKSEAPRRLWFIADQSANQGIFIEARVEFSRLWLLSNFHPVSTCVAKRILTHGGDFPAYRDNGNSILYFFVKPFLKSHLSFPSKKTGRQTKLTQKKNQVMKFWLTNKWLVVSRKTTWSRGHFYKSGHLISLTFHRCWQAGFQCFTGRFDRWSRKVTIKTPRRGLLL